MPFKKTKKGWEYDPNGKYRIPTDPNVFDKPIPPARYIDPITGYETDSEGKIDWKKIIDDANRKDTR